MFYSHFDSCPTFQFDMWTDGINALLGNPMVSKKTEEDLEMLLSMEIKMRLLDTANVPIPSEPPPIPPPPPDYNFYYDTLWKYRTRFFKGKSIVLGYLRCPVIIIIITTLVYKYWLLRVLWLKLWLPRWSPERFILPRRSRGKIERYGDHRGSHSFNHCTSKSSQYLFYNTPNIS